MPVSCQTASRLGPIHCGQSSARTAAVAKRTMVIPKMVKCFTTAPSNNERHVAVGEPRFGCDTADEANRNPWRNDLFRPSTGGTIDFSTNHSLSLFVRGVIMRTALLGLAVFFVCGADSDAVKKDMAALEGEWTMVSGERDGGAVPDELLKSAKRVSKDGETSVSFGEQLFMKAKFTVDPSKNPKTIDYDVTEGPSKGEK